MAEQIVSPEMAKELLRVAHDHTFKVNSMVRMMGSYANDKIEDSDVVLDYENVSSAVQGELAQLWDALGDIESFVNAACRNGIQAQEIST
jgi:hypothetical protein